MMGIGYLGRNYPIGIPFRVRFGLGLRGVSNEYGPM
jgi:hypothetical protein